MTTFESTGWPKLYKGRQEVPLSRSIYAGYPSYTDGGYMGTWAGLNFWNISSCTHDCFISNGPCVVNCTSDFGGIYSFHPGGTNVAICDGSVRFLKETTTKTIIRALIGRNEGTIISGDY